MNNPEFEADILDSKDKSGYSERETDLQIDKKGSGGQNVKQFNRGTNQSIQNDNTVVTFKKEKKASTIFEAKK